MVMTLQSNVDASAGAAKNLTEVADGLLGMWFFDTSIEKSTNDFGIPSNAKAGVVGSPNVLPDRMRFTANTNYLQTNVAEPDDLSFAIVLRTLYSNADMAADPNKAAFAVSNYIKSVSGIALGYSDPTTGRLRFGRMARNESGTSLLGVGLHPTAVDPTTWNLVWGTYSVATGIFHVECATTGHTGSANGAGRTPAKSVARGISIGSNSGGEFQNGPVEISQLRLYGVELSAAQVPLMLAEMRKYELTHNNGRVV